MNRWIVPAVAAALVTTTPALAQQVTNNPFQTPLEAVEGVIEVGFVEFASLPDIDDAAARMMLLVDEPGTGRLFVNDMRGPLYTVSYDGQTVVEYLNINAPRWGVVVESGGRERGFQSFALHPEFGRPGAPGYGRFYTWTDTQNMQPEPDFWAENAEGRTHDTVLLEWRANDPGAATYDGGPPRELFRFAQPFANHNAGHLAFNPLATPGDEDYGLLYVGSADGGSGGDPLNLSQNLSSGFGKVLRIDPLGSNSANGEYGIPASNPFAGAGDDRLGEIWAIGVRNPQRFGWDPVTGNMFLADIGQNIVEKVSLVYAGANLGWNDWEGSYRWIDRMEVSLESPRGDPNVTFPVVEYGQIDDILMGSTAVTGVVVYRSNAIPQLSNLVLFGDFPSGEIFYFQADDLPEGGHESIRRILLRDGGQAKTFLQVIREKNEAQGKPPATRTDLRFGTGPNDQVFLLNKHDGTIRLLVSGS